MHIILLNERKNTITEKSKIPKITNYLNRYKYQNNKSMCINSIGARDGLRGCTQVAVYSVLVGSNPTRCKVFCGLSKFGPFEC